MLNMQQKFHIRKDEIVQTTTEVAINRLKGPIHMVKGGHNLTKSPTPPITNDALEHIFDFELKHDTLILK